MEIEIRPWRPDDDPAITALLDTLWQGDEETYALFLPRPDREEPDGFHRSLVATTADGARIVGAANVGVRPWHPSHGYVHINVAQDAQGRGVGGAIYRHLQALLAGRPARPQKTATFEDRHATIGWLRRRGFIEQVRTYLPAVTVDQVAPDLFAGLEAALAAQGVTIHSLAELGADPALLAALADLHYAIYAAIHPHNPPGPALSAQRQRAFLGADLIPEALFVARQGGRLLGVASLRDLEQPGVLALNFVGVLEDCAADRLAIARALRRRELEYARRHGVRELRAEVDSVNALELAVLADIPSSQGPAWVTFEKIYDCNL